MPLITFSKPRLLQILINTALIIFTANLSAQSTRGSTALPYPYHPNRPGAQAYAQGGAFAANVGSVTSMLFNPAGIAQLEGKFAATLEAGWNSRTEYLPFFNDAFASQTHPLQFAGVALVPRDHWTLGAYYFRPTDYELDFGEIVATTSTDPPGFGQTVEPVFERRQFGFGINVARSFGKFWNLGAGVEWRRAEVRDEISSLLAKGRADAVRFTLGSVVRVSDWRLGISLQSQYKAVGQALTNDSAREIAPPPNDSRDILVIADSFDFTAKEPASVRAGFASPQFFKRLRVSGDVEFKSFDSEEPIPRWQFYGGTNLQLTSFLQLAAGSFTFRKDYSSFVDGPSSEVFLTCGGTLTLGQFQMSVSFMEGDVLNQDFEGQRFLNIAVGYVRP